MDCFLGRLMSAASESAPNDLASRETMLHEYLPRIIALLGDRSDPAVLKVVSDVQSLAGLARSAYQTLPMDLQVVANEQDFVDWIVSHQDDMIKGLRWQRAFDRDAVSSSATCTPEGNDIV
jgi:hypothetical protein